MRSVFRNGKQAEKTGPKNKGVRELCKEANKQIIENAPALIKALCDRIKKDGSPETTNALIRLAEMLDLNDKEELNEPEVSILDQWENEPEWTGETSEDAAEVAAINRELETWQSVLAAEPEAKQAAPPQAAQTGATQTSAAQAELGIRAVEPARPEANEPDPERSRSATGKPAGVVTASGFVVYQGAASPAPKETKAVDQPGK